MEIRSPPGQDLFWWAVPKLHIDNPGRHRRQGGLPPKGFGTSPAVPPGQGRQAHPEPPRAMRNPNIESLNSKQIQSTNLECSKLPRRCFGHLNLDIVSCFGFSFPACLAAGLASVLVRLCVFAEECPLPSPTPSRLPSGAVQGPDAVEGEAAPTAQDLREQ